MNRYVELVQKQFKEQLKDATYTFKSAETVKIGNTEFTLLEAKCAYAGLEMTPYMYLKKESVYMAVITCMSVSGADRATFEQMFF